jgi:NAD(P)H-nitrite reductase large subunit
LPPLSGSVINNLARNDDTQICSCHNVTKADVTKKVKDGTCKSIGDVKACTKAGTGCGGCMPLVQSIFNKEMKSMGQEVSNHCKCLPKTFRSVKLTIL